MILAHAGQGVSGWEWHPHPDVWLLVAGLAAGYWYAVTRVGPGVSRRKAATFVAGLAALWLHSDWPVHDIAEDYLFSVHMFQHIGFQLVAAPLLLVGTPDWLLRRLLVAPRGVFAVVRRIARPLPAALAFNAVTVVTHWPVVTNASLENHEVHFVVHVVIFASAVLMWLPVLNPLPELPRLGDAARMLYLFLQSVLPTVPASFLTFGESVIYSFYARVPRPFPISAIDDQQLAGAMMKIYAGGILWGVIVVIFFRWYAREEQLPRADGTLTWQQVERELARTQAPLERPGPVS